MVILGCSRLESSPVSSKLEVEILPDRCRFTLIVSNESDTEVILHFPTSQQYDIIVKSKDGEIVWQWSKNKMFTQVITSLTLKEHDEKALAREEYILPIGEYEAQGILTNSPDKIYTSKLLFSVQAIKASPLKGRVSKILDKFYLLGSDGTAYLIENPTEEIKKMENKEIEVTSFETEPIQGTIDKKIKIERYK